MGENVGGRRARHARSPPAHPRNSLPRKQRQAWWKGGGRLVVVVVVAPAAGHAAAYTAPAQVRSVTPCAGEGAGGQAGVVARGTSSGPEECS